MDSKFRFKFKRSPILFRQKLTIYKLHPDDSGKYFCRANDTETSAWLEVIRKYSIIQPK
jgi:hypothetical protein